MVPSDSSVYSSSKIAVATTLIHSVIDELVVFIIFLYNVKCEKERVLEKFISKLFMNQTEIIIKILSQFKRVKQST